LSKNWGQLLFGDRFLDKEFEAFPLAFVFELGLLVLCVHHKRRWGGLSADPADLFNLLDHFHTVEERHVEVKDE